MRMTCSGEAPGCRRRTFRTWASTAGRCVVSRRSKPRTAIVCDSGCPCSSCCIGILSIGRSIIDCLPPCSLSPSKAPLRGLAVVGVVALEYLADRCVQHQRARVEVQPARAEALQLALVVGDEEQRAATCEQFLDAPVALLAE